MVYADMNISYGFAPPCATDSRDDGNRAALLLVLRSGELHKDRHDTDEQVAVWRHRRYRECAVFATAAHLVWTISNNNHINFKHTNKKQRADWWDMPLVDWNEYGGKQRTATDFNGFFAIWSLTFGRLKTPPILRCKF